METFVSSAISTQRLKTYTSSQPADIYIICVPTPVWDGNVTPEPNISNVMTAIRNIAQYVNNDCTKVRYYHNGEYYEPHTDRSIQFLGFTYFYKEPKKFTGGELYFPKYDYEFDCENNSLIMFPGWVEHGVTEVKIQDSDYYDGQGRYAITSFFSNHREPVK